MPVDLLANDPEYGGKTVPGKANRDGTRAPRDLLAGTGSPDPMAAEAAAPMGTGEDVARSFGAGVRSGAESLLALPGEANRMNAAGAKWIAERLGVSEPVAEMIGEVVRRASFFPGAPDLEAVRAGTGAVVGDALRHDPQTLAGEYARTAGEFLPGAAIPGGAVARTAAVAVPAFLSETAGQVTEGTAAEPAARFVGAVAGGVGVGVGQAVNASRAASRAALARSANAAADEAAEFGVPLTRGQASGDIRALTREEGLRQVEGVGQQPMRAFDEAQKVAIARGADNVGAGFGRGSGLAEEMVPSGVKRIAASLEAKGNALYDKAFESGLMIQKEALDNLPTFIAKRLDENGRIIDDVLTPAASRALAEIRKAIDLSGALRPKNPSTSTAMAGEAGEVAGINLKGLHQIRRRINNLKGVNPDDWATLGQVKRAFDGWMDDAVDHFLYSGDDAALDAYREATRTWKGFRAITSPPSGDSAGKIVAKMMKDDAHAAEVSNWLYGANIARPNTNAPKVAKRLKSILGNESQEWAAIRAGAWERLTHAARDGDILSPTKAANNIEDFVNGSGRSLAREMFAREELETMRRFARTLRRTVPPKDATNPSRSGYTVAKSIQGIMSAMLGAVGANVTGGASGALMGFLALPVFRGVRDIRAVRSAVRQTPMRVPNVPQPKPALPAANALAVGGVNYLAPAVTNALAAPNYP